MKKLLTGLVPIGDVPPTVEIKSDGMIVRFYRHNPQKLWFDREKLLKCMNNDADRAYSEYSQFHLRKLKRTVVIQLVSAWSGHGILRLKKDEFLDALKSA